MTQNLSIKFLNQKRDNIILNIHFLNYIINNHQLALDRIKEAEDFVKTENKKVLNNPENSKELTAYLYVYYPDFQPDRVYAGYNDFINFSSAKAEIIIDTDERRNLILGNYDYALNSWVKARDNVLKSKKFLSDYVKLLYEQLNEISNKLSNTLYNEEEKIEKELVKTKKKNKYSADKIASMYLKTCENLNSIAPNPYELVQNIKNGPSKSEWYRNLENPGVLFNIKTRIEKKVSNNHLKKSNLPFWVNVRESIDKLMEDAAYKMSRRKEKSASDKIEYFKAKFDSMSQPVENDLTEWDRD